MCIRLREWEPSHRFGAFPLDSGAFGGVGLRQSIRRLMVAVREVREALLAETPAQKVEAIA